MERMSPFLLLSVLLGAGASEPGPLSVRVLEPHKLTSATVFSGQPLGCDGKKLEASSVSVRALGSEVLTEEGRCAQLWADRGTVSAGALKHSYRGKLRVTAAAGTLVFLNLVELEDYLASAVAAQLEGPPSALQAQAVVSRTFAIASRQRHRAAGYELCDQRHCQLYPGKEFERADATAAVLATRAQVLLLGGVMPKPAYFHESCGGATSSAADVFGAEGVIGGVKDEGPQGPLCSGANDFHWQWEVERAELARALGRKDQGAAFEVLRRDSGGRVLEVRCFGERLSGHELLLRLGERGLRSMKVEATEVMGVLTFRGRGAGHGVGLCQKGALELAAKGQGYRNILSHYFPEWRLSAP